MKCDVIANGIVAAAKQVGLTIPLVVRLEGTNVELGKEILADSRISRSSPADDLGDAARKVVAAARARRARQRRRRHEHLRRQEHPRPRPGHHRLRGQLPRRADARVRHAASSPASRRTAAARSSRRRSRSSTPSTQAVKETGANASVDLRPAAVRGRRDHRGRRRGRPARRRDHRGHPGARHGAGAPLPRRAARDVRLVGPNCPGRHHAGRVQDRDHAGPHPPARPHRRRLALRHAHLRGGGAAHRPRARPVDRGRHRRRSGPRHRLRRRASSGSRRTPRPRRSS